MEIDKQLGISKTIELYKVGSREVCRVSSQEIWFEQGVTGRFVSTALKRNMENAPAQSGVDYLRGTAADFFILDPEIPGQ